MKKHKLLIPLATLSCSLIPINMLVSCNKAPTFTQRIIQDATNEFYEICKYPHPTYYLDEIRGYLFSQARELGTTATRDDYGNMWFDVGANEPTREHDPKLILQAHMDMVYAGPEEKKFEPIIPQYHPNGNFLSSKDYVTSLGADDGIGIGLALAIVKNPEIKHGPIRLLFTADEEDGMIGAGKLPPEAIDTNYLISLDGEIENGGVYISCAGGAVFKLAHDYTPVSLTNTTFEIKARGFKGGHSGNDIGKLRGNAERFIFEGLNRLSEAGKTIQLVSFGHGDQEYANNALIPYAECVFTCDSSKEEIEPVLNNLLTEWQAKYIDDKDGMAFSLAKLNETNDSAIDETNSKKIITMIAKDLLYGVIDPKDPTEEVPHPNRSANIGPTSIVDGKFKFEKYDRATKKTVVDNIESNITNAFATAGFTSEEYDEVSRVDPWEEKEEGDLIIDLIKEGYTANNIQWYEKRTNGGVEPAKFSLVHPGLNQTCIGAKFIGVHSTGEQCYLDVLESSLKALLYVIENMHSLHKAESIHWY